MIDMAVNKIVYGTTVLVDLTSDSVTADALEAGKTAHGKDGNIVTGKNPYVKATTDAAVNTQAALIEQIMTALDGKVAGGGGGGVSIATCTMTVSYSGNGEAAVNYLSASGGSAESCFISFNTGSMGAKYENETQTIENVAVASPLIIYGDGSEFSIDNTSNCYCEYCADGIALVWIAVEDGSNECSFHITVEW